MANEKLSTKEILELKARAHHLNPVVMVGQQGLTEAVIKETEAELSTHNPYSTSASFWFCGVKIPKPDTTDPTHPLGKAV